MGRAAGRFNGRDRIGDHRLDRHPLVQQGVHEGGVGAVLQQASHQVGQQILMTADRRIDAQRERAVAIASGRIQRLSHPVQALKLRGQPRLTGHFAHGGQGVGVVGSELPIEVRRRGQERARADQIAQVGRRLGRVDGIAG